jgi:hypothetical protein
VKRHRLVNCRSAYFCGVELLLLLLFVLLLVSELFPVLPVLPAVPVVELLLSVEEPVPSLLELLPLRSMAEPLLL